jgi:glutamate transport system substrate-binding protein
MRGQPRGHGRAVQVAAAVVTLFGAAVSGCAGGAAHASVLDRAADDNKLVIGVKYDQPGLGLKDAGGLRGFDVDVARYVARRLGGPDVRVQFKEARSAVREEMLRRGQVDLIFATYSITPERHRKVDFAGPYYVAHQDTMVRADDKTINRVDDLEGKRLCQAPGSNSWKRVIEEKSIKAEPVAADTYSGCLTKLKAGQLDAVSTDDLILAGFAVQDPSAVRIVNVPFTDERYGVGIKQGDIDGCEAVNKALTEMYQDGTAGRLLDKWFGATDLNIVTSVPQFDGCR